ncbi:alcohol dehydrogenase [Rhodococcus sp. 06-235-1A]|uniref:NADP-dependent oxidoreductase n=1 Tax=Rhodococcus sp. 06-235-1A TaxID=2022508 RepID=UPI000B9ACA3C|nr:NADP-dependent oxidoreductase [Rhodococcus sp. 06-235-1A]OZD05002.1 alcohol dehydrogenase [Rhodococcus sp. 06-235-1A]
MARIIRPTAYGSPEVLGVVEAPIPAPTDDAVVVAVRAAGVNPIDWKLYSGAFHEVEDEHLDSAGVGSEPLPQLGLECAGVVSAVGRDVTDVRVGDEVVVYPVTAAYADYVVVQSDSLFAKPSAMQWPEAAGLMLTGTTAAHALHAAGVGSGETVLVHGGAGGVGLMAVQLAQALGAAVVATAAERNHDLLRSLGATPVAYGPGLVDRVRNAVPEKIDAALDLVGTDEALDSSLELVGDRRRIASITGSARRAEAGIKVLGYGPGEDSGAAFRAAARDELIEKVRSGELRVIVDATYPLDQASLAHEAGLAGHAPGKLILVP